ncbi:MAG: primosomal protein N', partial [Candidatus Omnitrophica bacterium]|nr:primosomal protein N' [Candidatus Omnitrophota bacterium]
SLGQSAIVLVPDIAMLGQARARMAGIPGAGIDEVHRNQPHELEVWLGMRQGDARIVVGTRSAVFAPVPRLGLIIVDEEHDPAYKQDQTPHYHARTVSLMRAKIEQAKLILGGTSVSLESYYRTRRRRAAYVTLPGRDPESQVRTVDMKNFPLLDRKRKIILSRYVQDSIVQALAAKDKVLVVHNRKGFATVVSCSTCGKLLKCPRCNMNLVYYYSDGSVRCRYCNFQQPLPKFCPECKSGYLKLGGMGTEKVESELARMFPAARIRLLERTDEPDRESADIFVATQSIVARTAFKFGLTCVLGIDNSLNFVDFRAAERVFGLLTGLVQLTEKSLLIQTGIPGHYVFEALKSHDPQVFYRKELNLRRQTGFPPYRNFVSVKLRGASDGRVRESAEKLFSRLAEAKPADGSAVISVNPGQPAKLRGNFHWTILVSTAKVKETNAFLKSHLRHFRSSGIKVIVDVDPV